MSTSRRLRRVFALLLSASLLTITAGAVSAAPKPKVPVCHLDQVTDTYTLLAVAQLSVAKHLAHGDGLPGEGDLDENCQPVTPPRVFVRAFTNGDGVAGYNPATDLLITELVDTNLSNTVDAGDTVRAYGFPTNLAATSFSTFGITSHTVVTTVNVASDWISVSDDGGVEYDWVRVETHEFYRERLRGIAATSFQDAFDGEIPDFILTQIESASQPGQAISDTDFGATALGDRAFIDVTFELP